jgi:alkylation response protein AidB-like acyl-CoA dehydrogenase
MPDARRRMGRPETLELARAAGRTGDPIARQQIAHLFTLQKIQQWNQQRSKSALVAGKQPGPEASIAKLMSGVIGRASAAANASIAGAAAMLAGADAPFEGAVASEQLGYHSGTIGGGTDNIQHNIVGERVLGLPKDIQVDAGVPFREVRVSPTRAR